MPVKKSNSKISACPGLAINLLQILIPTSFNSLLFQKRQITLQLCPKRWLVRKVFGYNPQKVKILYINFYPSKKEDFRKLPVPMTGRTGLHFPVPAPGNKG